MRAIFLSVDGRGAVPPIFIFAALALLACATPLHAQKNVAWGGASLPARYASEYFGGSITFTNTGNEDWDDGVYIEIKDENGVVRATRPTWLAAGETDTGYFLMQMPPGGGTHVITFTARKEREDDDAETFGSPYSVTINLLAEIHPNLEWQLIDTPATAGPVTAVRFNLAVKNTGDTTLDSNYSISMWGDLPEQRLDTFTFTNTQPGAVANFTLNATFPNMPGSTRTYHFWALGPLGAFGTQPTRNVTILAVSYDGTRLSATTFSSSPPLPIISTTDQMPTYYRLRAKVMGVPGFPDGFHMANAWRENQPASYAIDTVAPVGNYSVTGLYWLKYSAINGTLLAQGPERLVPVSIISSTNTLSSYDFDRNQPPTISTTEPMNGSNYELHAVFTSASGTSYECAGRSNQNNYPLSNLPPPGNYSVVLSWKKFDTAGNVVFSKTEPAIATTITVGGPAAPPPAGPVVTAYGGHVDASPDFNDDGEQTGWNCDPGEALCDFVIDGGPRHLHLSYGGVAYSAYGGLVLRGPGFFWSSPDGGGQSASLDFDNLPNGTYTLDVIFDGGGDYTLVGQSWPQGTPAVTSPSSVSGIVGVPFSFYVTTDKGANNFAIVSGALPPGLSLNTTTGRINGTPTAAGTYTLQVRAHTYTDSTPQTLTLTVAKSTPTLTFASQTFSTPTTITSAMLNATVAGVPGLPAPTGNLTYAITTGGSGNPVGQTLAAGAQITITATYPGDSNYAPISVPATFSVASGGGGGGGGSGGGAAPPLINTQPATVVATIGQSAAFNVVASGTGPLTYQWRRNGTAISGATSSALTLSNLQTADGGGYSVVVSNSAGTVTSADASLIVGASDTNNSQVQLKIHTPPP